MNESSLQIRIINMLLKTNLTSSRCLYSGGIEDSLFPSSSRYSNVAGVSLYKNKIKIKWTDMLDSIMVTWFEKSVNYEQVDKVEMKFTCPRSQPSLCSYNSYDIYTNITDIFQFKSHK